MTKREFERWRTSRNHFPMVVEFEQQFIGNHPDPHEIRAFFMRHRDSDEGDLSRIAFAPSASRLLDEDLASTYDETLWHAVHDALFRLARTLRHLDHLFWACHVPESIMARTHVALVNRNGLDSLLRFIKYGERPEQFIESLSPHIRQELCKRKIHGWEDVQWSLPLNVTGLQKSIEPGLLRAIDEDDVATFSILKTFTRKKWLTLVKIALAHHAWKILAQEAERFREPIAGICLRSILLVVCSHPDNQQGSVLIHKLEKLSPGIVRNTFDASGNDPLWYTLYSGICDEWRCKWTPIPRELVDTLVAYGCDPARRNRNGISFQAMNAELLSERDIEVTSREPQG